MGSCLCKEKKRRRRSSSEQQDSHQQQQQQQECQRDGRPLSAVSGRLIIDSELPLPVRTVRTNTVPCSVTIDHLVLETLSVIRTLVEK
jgi:hypothetical protein